MRNRCQYAVFTHRLIDHCRLSTTPKWSKSFIFCLLSFFLLAFRPHDIHKIVHVVIRIWIWNQLFLPPHITFFLLFHLKTFIFIHSAMLIWAPWINRTVYIYYHLYNGISPDLRRNGRVNESKLSVLSWWCILLCIFLFCFNTVTEWESGIFIFRLWFCFVVFLLIYQLERKTYLD